MAIRWSYRKREAFADERGRRCAVCGKSGLMSRKECAGDFSKVYHIDHISPESRGGTEEEENLRLLCVSCNAAKGAMSAADFDCFIEIKTEVRERKAELVRLTGADASMLDRALNALSVREQHELISKIYGRMSYADLP